MIEYLLIVVVGVTLIGALTMALFRPLGAFIEAVNRQYIQCLLETGELPALKNQQQMLCAAPKAQFGKMDPANSPNGSGLNSSKTPNEANADTSGSGSKDSQDTANSGGAQNRKSSVIRDGMRSSGSARSEGSGNKITIIPVESFNEGNGYMSLSSQASEARAKSQKSRQIAIASLSDSERKKLEKESKKISSLPTENETFTRGKKKKVIVKPPPPRAVAEEVNSGIEFGFYFRIFFIIIIILFLIILLGGQAMQISKNWE